MENDIRIEDLHPTCRMLANLVGIENALSISKALGGTSIYIPQLNTATAKARVRKIIEEFDGHNYTELSRRHGVTDVYVRDLVRRARAEARSKRG